MSCDDCYENDVAYAAAHTCEIIEGMGGKCSRCRMTPMTQDEYIESLRRRGYACASRGPGRRFIVAIPCGFMGLFFKDHLEVNEAVYMALYEFRESKELT